MQFSEKLQSRQEEEELNSLPVGSLLIYLQDVLTNRRFLVDTGPLVLFFLITRLQPRLVLVS